MKKTLIAFLLCLAVLLPCTALAGAHILDQCITKEAADYFGKDSFNGWEIVDGAVVFPTYSSIGSWQMVVASKNGQNVLHAFKQVNGHWKHQYQTAGAVPQGKGLISAGSVSSWTDPYTGKVHKTPTLVLALMDSASFKEIAFAAYELSKGSWKLFRYWDTAHSCSLLIADGSITYYKHLTGTQKAGTVKGTFQRAMIYTSLDNLPRTLSAAKKKLTIAPALPESDELTAEEINFSGGKQYPVYSAPDKTSLRGGKGKAAVSTNGWIQVFGQEGNWILVQYSIDAEHYRIGYISADALPKKASVPVLKFRSQKVVLPSGTQVTDDPFFSQAVLTIAQKETEVTLLGVIGDWAYISGYYEEAHAAWRGFVPCESLAAAEAEPVSYEQEHSFVSVKGDQATPVYRMFRLSALLYDAGNNIIAVEGSFGAVGTDASGCDIPTGFNDTEKMTYTLAPGFCADLLTETDEGFGYLRIGSLSEWQGAGDTDSGLYCMIELDKNNDLLYLRETYVPWR